MKNHPQSTGQNYLMAIAIEEYAHFPNAPMAVQKVEGLVKTLQAKYRFAPEHTTLLSNEEATLENIFQVLETLINKLGAEDRLLLIFAGWSDSKKLFNQSYWIPSNAQEGKTHQYLATSELLSTLQSFKSKQILVVSDAIFFPIFYEPFQQETNYPDTANGTTAHWLLASGASIQDGTFQESTFIDQFNKTLLENPGEYLINEVVHKMKEGLSEEQSSQLIFGHFKGVARDKVAIFKLNPQLNEAAEWAICKQENDLLAYNLFLQKHPDGTYAEEARQKLLSFQEDIDWENALSANTVDAYLNYKKKYRNGKFSSEADEKMAMASIASFAQQETPSETPESNKPTAPKDNPNQPSDYTRTPTRLSPKSFVAPKKRVLMFCQRKRKRRKIS